MHRVIGERAPSGIDGELARSLLRSMVRARVFDERAVSLQRRGWMSGYPPFEGAEASQVGAATAMADEDVLVPTYRSNAMQLARGVPMADILRFRRGFPEYGSGHDVPVFPQSITIATGIPQAVGIGMAATHRDTGEAVLCYFGDGATSEGDFHEGLNVAGVFDAPVVFFCENNGWAISTPEPRQTASGTITQKADAYGIGRKRVDGNDPIAVYETVREALSAARAGLPVLVESLTHRRGPHTTSDDPSRYRDRASFPEWRTADPIERFEAYLLSGDVLDADLVQSVRAAVEDELDAAVQEAERATRDPEDLFEWAYAEATPALDRQREAIREWLDRHDDPYGNENQNE
ncbi:MAG: thiamine pyrophosphate-dependent enzyme [Halobacteriota archaeon]|uniref:thiamine pyrophosphate-dependent enzyme n=1 Tax=Natronomonas sp. TaxID=2184060 RepID=UPI003975F57D